MRTSAFKQALLALSSNLTPKLPLPPQNWFPFHLSPFSSTPLTSMDPSIPLILNFWFAPSDQLARWFGRSETVDNLIRRDFGDLVRQARTPALDDWTSHPQGALAMLILLDQFPRNIFRGSGGSYSSDAKAVEVATGAIVKGYDREVPLVQQSFFYLPFMHNETLLGQIAGRAFYEGWLRRCEGDAEALGFAKPGVVFMQKHLDVIAMFGRFPSRNEVLGRETTVEEARFLEKNPMGFDMSDQKPRGSG